MVQSVECENRLKRVKKLKKKILKKTFGLQCHHLFQVFIRKNLSSAGVVRICDNGTKLKRFFWSIVVCMTFFFMCYMTYKVTKEYLEYKKIVEQTGVMLGSMKFPAVTICSLTKLNSINIKTAGMDHFIKLQKYLESARKLPYPLVAMDSCNSNPACEWSWFHHRCRCLSNPCEAEFCGNGDPICPCSNILCNKYPEDCFKTSTTKLDDICFCHNNSNLRKTWKQTINKALPIDLLDIKVNDLLEVIRGAEVEDLVDVEWAFQPDLLSIANYGPSFDSLVISCSFQRKRCDQRNFTVMYTPSHGKCYTFNYAGRLSKKHDTAIVHTKRYGWNSGLQLYMQVQSNEILDLLSKDIGVKVVVHDPMEIPYVSEYGLTISAGDSTAIQVERKQINRLGPPWGRCLVSGKHLPFNYTHQPYSQLGCQRHCQNFYIKRQCSCLRRSLMTPFFQRPTQKEINQMCNFSIPSQKQCALAVIKLIENDTISCNCDQPCREDIFDTSLSAGKVNEDYFRLVRTANTLTDLGNGTYGAPISRNTTNILGLRVYYRTLTLLNTTERPAYSWETLIANIGGNLGFFMGLTLMTFFEIIELVIDFVSLILRSQK